jgi:1-deoxy-D-xylulose-5-phosphate synthase
MMSPKKPVYLTDTLTPSDLKDLSAEELTLLAEEIREEIIKTVTRNGGHLASSLGAVELIVSLHHVFNSPEDKIIFDVGHQAYAHKIITQRYKDFGGLRLAGGLSGFPRREESPSDVFNTGHSSTSISAALGLAAARDLLGEKHNVVAVIGDGALTGGMALEALNHAGGLFKNILVILNDNRMSISPNVGAISQYLSLKLTSPEHLSLREKVKSTLRKFMPHRGARIIRRFQGAEEALKSFLISPRSFLAAWGFKYLGPIDGHDIDKLIEALKHVKLFDRPVFLHVLTTKGKGYRPAEDDPLLFHGLGTAKGQGLPYPASAAPEEAPGASSEADLPRAYPGGELPDTGPAPLETHKGPPPIHKLSPKGTLVGKKTYTDVFGEFMVAEARKDSRLVAVTAAMSQGTGLSEFFKKYPERAFDVGIAEQHAVTLAAAMAAGGLKPIVAIYSTFLQRAFDQLYHDIALQGLPVLFAVDRAGLVGEDGPTHHGALDLSYLRLLPGFILMAPKDEFEFLDMLKLGIKLSLPSAIRYPRGPIAGSPPPSPKKEINLGEAELLREGEDLTIAAIGITVIPALRVAEALKEKNKLNVGVINVRFVKPLDKKLILENAAKTRKILVVEENTLSGGLRGAIAELLAEELDGPFKMASIGLPEPPPLHGTQAGQRAETGLDFAGIMGKCLELIGKA